MKNNLLKFLGLCLTLTALAGLAPRSYANVDQAASFYGQIAASGVKVAGAAASANNSAVSTTTVVMELFYNGSATAAYASIYASSMTFYAPYGVIDTSIGNATYGATAGTFDLSASSVATLGQLCDLINGIGVTVGTNGSANGGSPTGSSYHCTLVGGIRSDLAQTNILPNVNETSGVNNLAAVGGYMVPTSTTQFISLGIIPASGRHVVLNYVVANSTGAPVVQVFGVLAKYGIGASGFDAFGNPQTDSSLVWASPTLVYNTTTAFPLSTAVAEPWLEFGQGGVAFNWKNAPTGNFYNGHVVIRVNAVGSGYQNNGATNFVSASWLEK